MRCLILLNKQFGIVSPHRKAFLSNCYCKKSHLYINNLNKCIPTFCPLCIYIFYFLIPHCIYGFYYVLFDVYFPKCIFALSVTWDLRKKNNSFLILTKMKNRLEFLSLMEFYNLSFIFLKVKFLLLSSLSFIASWDVIDGLCSFSCFSLSLLFL